MNSQVGTLTPMLSGLRSTGVYFERPAPAHGLPLLPGTCVTSIQAPTPVMVGEFAGKGGERFALLVNLSLVRSTKMIVTAQAKRIRRVSPVDRSLQPLANDGSLRLAAGQGVLLELS